MRPTGQRIAQDGVVLDARGDDDAPCFARGSSAASHFSFTPPSLEHPLGTCLLGSTTACRVTRGTSAAEAFPQCFGDAPSTTAEAVLMSSLTAGTSLVALSSPGCEEASHFSQLPA